MKDFPVGWLLLILSVIIAGGFAALWNELHQENQELKQILTEQRQPVPEPVIEKESPPKTY